MHENIILLMHDRLSIDIYYYKIVIGRTQTKCQYIYILFFCTAKSKTTVSVFILIDLARSLTLSHPLYLVLTTRAKTFRNMFQAIANALMYMSRNNVYYLLVA